MARRTRVVKVKASSNYKITISSDLFAYSAATIRENSVAIISDDIVFGLYGESLKHELLKQGKTVNCFQISAGENSKSFESYKLLLSKLAESGLDRSSAIIALGGGVVGDLAGFVAASYMRGIAFYQMPTTLLAMVDASIGGKTAINIKAGKNLVGAFWQPQEVFINVDFLKSLSLRAFKQGAVEHFKHGLIASKAIIKDIYNEEFKPEGATYFLIDTITKSVAVKAAIVSDDEREQGKRAFLNYGHNIAHAIEAASNHRVTHGDAVAYGLLFDAYLGYKRGYEDLRFEAIKFLEWIEPAKIDFELNELEPYLATDKKTKSNVQHFVLLKSLEKPIIVNDISRAELASAWQFVRDTK